MIWPGDPEGGYGISAPCALSWGLKAMGKHSIQHTEDTEDMTTEWDPGSSQYHTEWKGRTGCI